ncbi:DNA-directed RNA polymerase II core subunit rpb9 [Tulasnella sp. 403]|nr:DNA-directed RNA polymerase II core subunit rpb9 [Tulasnella sp. 403]
MSTLQFCSECNNILSPKADPARRLMLMWCRSCNAEETSQSPIVYKNDLLTDTRERAGVTQDLGLDPTLPHAIIACPKCGNEDAVFYQDQSKRKETRMILFYVCTSRSCGFVFNDPALKTVGNLDLGDSS